MSDFIPYFFLAGICSIAINSFRIEGLNNRPILDILWGSVLIILSIFLTSMAYFSYFKISPAFSLLKVYAWFLVTFFSGIVALINGIWKMRLKTMSLARLENYQKYGDY